MKRRNDRGSWTIHRLLWGNDAIPPTVRATSYVNELRAEDGDRPELAPRSIKAAG